MWARDDEARWISNTICLSESLLQSHLINNVFQIRALHNVSQKLINVRNNPESRLDGAVRYTPTYFT